MESIIASFRIDTLLVSKLLKQADFSEKQAEAITEIVKQNAQNSEKSSREIVEKLEQQIRNYGEEHSTKGDLPITEKKLELEIEKVRAETEKLRTELESKIEISRANLEIKIEQTKSDLIKWVAGLMLAQTGFLFALIKFFL
jgi:hypothetical protein